MQNHILNAQLVEIASCSKVIPSLAKAAYVFQCFDENS